MKHKLPILFLTWIFTLSALGQNIEFVENKGQWDTSVRFLGKVQAGAFAITKDGFRVLQHNTKDWGEIAERVHGHGSDRTPNEKSNITLHSHAYGVSFAGSNPKAQIIADKPLNTYSNYFIGNDPSKWGAHCNIYQGITVKDIYPNIDVRYYSGGGYVKYDLIVHPGGDPAAIQLKYTGTDGIETDGNELRIKTTVGSLKEKEPYTYQYAEAGKVTIPVKYAVKNNIVSFTIKAYNPKTTLIIDPTLVFVSFSGSSADNWGFTATYGPDGSMYGGGIVFNSGFPSSNGSFQTTYGGGEFDIGIIKLTSDGTSRVYATYVGGSGEDQPHSLIVNNAGELILAGRSNSSNYPQSGAGSGTFGALGGYDIVVTKLNADGTGIIGSKRIGGKGDDGVNISATRRLNSLQRNYGDDGRSEVILDGAGNIYVASSTQSLSDVVADRFPTRNAFQSTPGNPAPIANVSVQDGVVMKLDPNITTLLFSSFLGGLGQDAAYVLSINPLTGNLYVGGGSSSPSLPGTDATGLISGSNNGQIDGFVTMLTPSGGLIKTTFVGTTDIDQVYGVQFDEKGFPYIMGQTLGNWPVINALWSQNNGRQFIAKLQPDLSAYIYSTKFGKGSLAPDISPVAFLVDRCENVYISGWGGRLASTDFPSAGVFGLPVTPDALKPAADAGPSGTGEDFYFFVLKRDAVSQLYGSFFGQNNNPSFGDHVDGGTSRFDKNGVIYQAICASCASNNPFPQSSGPTAWSPTKPTSASCNLAMVKIAFNLNGTQGKVRPSINGVIRDSTGCVPLTIDFTDTIQIAPNYEWNFGDGSPQISTDTPSVRHTYLAVGRYRVMMIAIDPTKCFPRDTSYVNVSVGDNEATPNFRPVKLSPPCDIFRYRFDNQSAAPAGIPFKSTTFTWDFGDGTPTVQAGGEAVFHTYANPGTYIVKLLLNDTAYCNSPETRVDTLRVAANVRAVFRTPNAGCTPYNAVFSNQSVGGSTFTWNFGDGSAPLVTTASTVSYSYLNPGAYTVRLTAVDSNTCNIIDSTRFTITVAAPPTAQFNPFPQPPTVNTPISYTNNSSLDAIRFKWIWGDGDSLLTTSRAVLQHDFNLAATYNTCLTATNRQGCTDTFCAPVQTIIDPAIDVPNAFTPGRADANSIIYVRGYGITKMKFTIYARWGEKVFESTSRSLGWNGFYKGKLLPMDAYAYTLDVELVDGRKVRKTGDITLIR